MTNLPILKSNFTNLKPVHETTFLRNSWQVEPSIWRLVNIFNEIFFFLVPPLIEFIRNIRVRIESSGSLRWVSIFEFDYRRGRLRNAWLLRRFRCILLGSIGNCILQLQSKTRMTTTIESGRLSIFLLSPSIFLFVPQTQRENLISIAIAEKKKPSKNGQLFIFLRFDWRSRRRKKRMKKMMNERERLSIRFV